MTGHGSGPGSGAGARLIVRQNPRAAVGVALVLHGGGGRGTVPVSPTQPSVLRMIPIAGRIAGAGRGRIAVLRLLNRYRGVGRDPLVDLRWALDQVRHSHPGLPIALVGHSLGGTVALNAAGEPRVTGVVALAPWLSGGHEFAGPSDVATLIVHGSDDAVTDPAAAARYAEAARADGAAVSFVRVDGGSHAMLRRRPAFDTLAARFVAAVLDPDRTGPTRGPGAALNRLARRARDHPGDFDV